MNLDEDHVSNFGSLKDAVRIGQLWSNPTLSARDIILLKSDGIGPGVRGYLEWLSDPLNQIAYISPDFGTMHVWGYYNPYVPGVTDTTNNLSLLLLIQYGAFKIVFSGDLEDSGWRRMLEDPRIRHDLLGTGVFVASHHGREGGCSAELFEIIRPEVVIVSDDERQHDSQMTDAWYRQRCTGVPLIGNPSQRRYVYTTRRDGSLSITANEDGTGVIQPIHVPDWPVATKRASRQAMGLGMASGFNSGSRVIGLGLANPFLSAVDR
jgi:hypothetical protein